MLHTNVFSFIKLKIRCYLTLMPEIILLYILKLALRPVQSPHVYNEQ